MRQVIYIFLALMLLSSCKKDKVKTSDGYSEIPAIEFISINNTTVKQFQDSVVVIISYKDLNGDLGRQNPDDNSLYIKDQRLPDADYYHIPPISPDDVEFKTRGTIRIYVPTLFLFGNGGNEKTVLTIKVMDQAGHWSNEISTPEIIITE